MKTKQEWNQEQDICEQKDWAKRGSLEQKRAQEKKHYKQLLLGIEQVKDQVAVQNTDGNWNYDPYMYGFANGLLCALATIEDKEPSFLDAPKSWLADSNKDNYFIATVKKLLAIFHIYRDTVKSN